MRLRSCITAILLLAAGAPALAAQGPEAITNVEPFAEAIVELHINEHPAATTLVVRRDVDGTLLLRAADLPDLRLKPPSRGVRLVNGERYFRLGPEMGAVVARCCVRTSPSIRSSSAVSAKTTARAASATAT